jgi:hypothetical protein
VGAAFDRSTVIFPSHLTATTNGEAGNRQGSADYHRIANGRNLGICGPTVSNIGLILGMVEPVWLNGLGTLMAG